MKKILCKYCFILLLPISVCAQQDLQDHYHRAFQEQLHMLQEEIPSDFKRSVFLAENAYYGGTLNYEAFCDTIHKISDALRIFIQEKGFEKHKTSGNWAVFMYLTEPISANQNKAYSYDFDDFMGTHEYSKMFVTKLLATKSGNCHSLPMLYKILADEMGVSSYLTLAPNHLYIKHIDEAGKWTNLELTNGGFPRDQWIIQQMNIGVEAIKNEIYMTPLTSKQSIALTMFDLACAYKFQFGYDSFVVGVIDTALAYFPTCIPLLALKADAYESMGLQDKRQEILKQMFALGYQEMPLQEYENWVSSLEEEFRKKRLLKN
jgi:hypothetical protein